MLAVTSHKTKPRSDLRASYIRRPVIVPHTAKRRKLRPRTCKGIGAFSLGSSHSASTASAVCRKSIHALEDNRRQLHDLLIQDRVFLDVALDPTAVGVRLRSQGLEFVDEILNLLRRRLRYAAHQYAKIVGRGLTIANFGLTKAIGSRCQFADISTSTDFFC